MRLKNLRPSELRVVAEAAETIHSLWKGRAKTNDPRATDVISVTPETWWENRGSDGTGRAIVEDLCDRINPKLKGGVSLNFKRTVVGQLERVAREARTLEQEKTIGLPSTAQAPDELRSAFLELAAPMHAVGAQEIDGPRHVDPGGAPEANGLEEGGGTPGG